MTQSYTRYCDDIVFLQEHYAQRPIGQMVANDTKVSRVAVLGMNGLTLGEMKMKLCGWTDTFEVHLDTHRERGPVKGFERRLLWGIV
jgi:hypothetical protein